jgi:hypothetical protein
MNPCIMCGEMTRKFLFNDKKLNIPICSGECEHKYIETMGRKDEGKVLSHLEHKIEKTKWHEKIGWTVAGVGLFLVIVGFLAKYAEVFLVGIFPMTIGAFSTRHFEAKIEKLTRMKKRIAIWA